MTTTQAPAPSRTPSPTVFPGRRPVDWHRLRSAATALSLAGCFVGTIGLALGTVVAGRIADQPGAGLVALLALCVVGGSLVETAARTTWTGVVSRAEGELRADLLQATLAQPLSALGETAVGEILDRIDDDTYDVGRLLRQVGWMSIRTILAAGPLWLVAGLTWWPAFVVFPLVGALALLIVRPYLAQIASAKVSEEAAWTDQAAIMEEGIAARDDLRASLGQAHVLRRASESAAVVHRRFAEVMRLQRAVELRSSLVLHALLAGTAVTGVAMAVEGNLSTAALVTLFLVTSNFVGQVDMVARHLPELQSGMGAVLRLRALLAVPAEPSGGAAMPSTEVGVEFRDLTFSYPEQGPVLAGIDLAVQAGQTMALVGRTGSGKSTLASLISRAAEPSRGSVFVGGIDVLDLDLQALRARVGVVTQRTEILAGTVAENITLFTAVSTDRVEAAVAELGLSSWVAGLPRGLNTPLGPGGTSLSAGEEQLIAFARLLVREVDVVVLDEATARMDPVTEARVTAAAERLLAGRTGLLIAHRLSTTERADVVAVLEDGKVLQAGERRALASRPGPFRDLLVAAENHEPSEPIATVRPGATTGSPTGVTPGRAVGHRRSTTPPPPAEVEPTPRLASATRHALLTLPRWSVVGLLLFLASALLGAFGAVTGWVWGHVITDLQGGGEPWALTALVVTVLLAGPLLLSQALMIYLRWWIDVKLRVRTAVLAGQIRSHRLERVPAGEAVSRAMDAERIAQYADRWVDVINGVAIVLITMVLAGTPLAGLVLLVVMVASAGSSALGRHLAGRSAAAASAARAGFGRVLVSVLESARTVKLAAATDAVHRRLEQVDAGRVDAAVREYRIKALLEGVPIVMVQVGIVTAWAIYDAGGWGLATALLVANAVAGFDWFGRVAGSAVTEAPGTAAWLKVASPLAGGGQVTALPHGIDLVTGAAPAPAAARRTRLDRLTMRRFSAIHDDGTIGVSSIDLDVEAGEFVLLLGPVGSGKSSLLGALAGLITSTGDLHWNGAPVADPQTTLRPPQVAHVAQVPRVLSGSFADNIELDHPDRDAGHAIATAQLARDVDRVGGPRALVGHRGVRLSGGQVQRVALARALACDAELLVADDVSSALDAATELELWAALRRQGRTVIGATSKAAALARADRVVVLDGGRVVAEGPWVDLRRRWGHLAG